MEREQETQKIFFKDLLFAALYCWKTILIVAIVFAILLGGFAVFRNNKNVILPGFTMTPENNAVVEQLKETLAAQKNDIAQQTEYIENSVLMSLDSYATYTASLYVFVAPEDFNADLYNPSASILYGYRNIVVDETTIAKLAEQFDMDASYFRELLATSIPTNAYLELTIRADSEENASAYIAGIEEVLQANKAQVSAATAPHALIISAFQSGPKQDTNLYNQQSAIYQRLKNTKAEYAVNESELNRLLPTEIIPADSNPVLFAVIGAFLGVCLVVGCAWIGHIASSKIYSARTLSGQTGIRVLGCIATTTKKDPITRWLRKLEGRSDNTNLAAAAVNIRNRCKDVKTLLIMGEYGEETVNALVQNLEQSGISCILCKDPYNSADALEALPCCDAVVLAETCQKTRYDRVAWAMELVADHGKQLLGCVLING